MNNSSCESCKYYDPSFGCMCDQIVYPCEKEEIDNILEEMEIDI